MLSILVHSPRRASKLYGVGALEWLRAEKPMVVQGSDHHLRELIEQRVMTVSLSSCQSSTTIPSPMVIKMNPQCRISTGRCEDYVVNRNYFGQTLQKICKSLALQGE